MTQETDIFNLFIKLTPPGLALLLWAYGVYNQSSLKKRWPELPGSLTIHDKKEALHAMISAEERKTRASFKMAIFFTAIAIFWTVYI
ncbi:hypothetical protein P3S64_25970 [Enterobacter hormaechei]|uniref:hypothetical protein n=1 Tax=Enterobacter hormaechei TaxID=158836 RepID=UPI0023E4485D|nr:hypothetical protein [Enterobacter hormaechei]MDF3803745.1 hypothetical protein [Enterobacter hormaechei]